MARALGESPVLNGKSLNKAGASRGGFAPAPALEKADLTGRATSGFVTCVADVSLNLAYRMAGRNRMAAQHSGIGSVCRSPSFGKPIRIARHNPI
jgi:hypothetical protein